MNQNQYKIEPIGIIKKENHQYMIHIHKKYVKGLNCLSLFSHAILIYQNKSLSNIWNTPLSMTVVKLKEVKEKQGTIHIASSPEFSEACTLYDLKPYFPNEDRVQKAEVPKIKPNSSSFYSSGLSPLGIIHKTNGNYTLEIPDHFDAYIKALEGYSHIKIVWWFHKFEKEIYKKTLECDPPYENAPKTGIFASRSPVRPNPIALTTAKIIRIDPITKRIHVSLLDCFDNTPLLGISPYEPSRDAISDCHLPHWLEHWNGFLDDREFISLKPKLSKPVSERIRTFQEIMPQQSVLKQELFSSPMSPSEEINSGITIEGARQNNLKNITVTLPYEKVTVLTGVSGSRKSSLAFDTLYAESQQRFLASLSHFERSSFSLLEKPKVDRITGLPLAIAISQGKANRNPRSTVGTITDLYDLLRTLFSNIGIRHCPECGHAIVKMTIDEITELLKHCRTGTLLKIKPVDTKEYTNTLTTIDLNDSTYSDYLYALDKAVRDGIKNGNGAIHVQIDHQAPYTFQTTEKCYECGHIFFELTPSDFSFNNTESMCPVCNGLGEVMDIDVDRIIKYPSKSILDGASVFWGNLRKFQKAPNANWMKGEILALADDMNIDLEMAWKELPEAFKQQAIYGTDKREVTYTYHNKNGRTGTITRPAEGAYPILKRLLHSNGFDLQKTLFDEFVITKPCVCCEGERLKLESRLVTIADTRFPIVVNMNLSELKNWIQQLPEHLTSSEIALTVPLLHELNRKLTDYIDIGLGYLTLDRSVPTLSGGEWQRLQLVSQLNSGLSHILYIFDEPTTGLHPKDYAKLMGIIERLKALHNTILIVEHARSIMMSADYLLDFGPKAGTSGGYLIAQGTPKEIMLNKTSETGLYLSNQKRIQLDHFSDPANWDWIKVQGITANNLQNMDIQFPINALTCISGVSGSGKSTLVQYGILPSIQSTIEHTATSQNFDSVSGAEKIDKIVHVTQKPIGRSSRSTPATYTGMMDEIRSLFAKTNEAVKLGYSPSQFSYNSKDGQCPVCHGYGYKTLEAAFMPQTKIECPLCKGKRFNDKILHVHYKDKTIADILALSIHEAHIFFKENKKLSPLLQLLEEIGLGYLLLGQSSQTLSGGEAQRIKLATHLHLNSGKRTLYLLDEPTTGLHFSDTQNLLNILGKMIQQQNTVILIEHNLDVIQNADWVIDLGPEGGDNGGKVVAQGTVQQIMSASNSHTGKLLSITSHLYRV